MTLDNGTRLGCYEVLSRLGAGGMGEVYRARDTELGRTVAIKILRADDNDETRRRLRREAQVPHSITPTSHRSTDSRKARVYAAWSWSSWKARRSASA